jgi:hypothetical protein
MRGFMFFAGHWESPAHLTPMSPCSKCMPNAGQLPITSRPNAGLMQANAAHRRKPNAGQMPSNYRPITGQKQANCRLLAARPLLPNAGNCFCKCGPNTGQLLPVVEGQMHAFCKPILGYLLPIHKGHLPTLTGKYKQNIEKTQAK